jgi:integrase
MSKRRALTDIAIKNLKPGADRIEIADPGARGLYLVIQASGVKSFALRYRLRGKPQKLTLGRWQSAAADLGKAAPEPKIGDVLSLAGARKLATSAQLQLGRGIDPADERRQHAEASTISEMLDDFVKRYCKQEKKLRSTDTIESAFERLVKPDLGDLSVYELRRSHVTDMLDDIADENGPVAADRVLAYFRKACNWYATRDDRFNSPIVPGMARSEYEARNRILADDEIKDLWASLGTIVGPSCWAPFTKSLLLCATRRNESARMHSSEIDRDEWIIPGSRYKRLPKHKGCDHLILLSPQARALIGEKPQGVKGNAWFIFSTTGGEKPISGYSKMKLAIDRAIADLRNQEGRDPMPPWRLHDLRRTARTLMSRAGVEPDHAERCLGHIIGGVRGVYDRHEFAEEKRAAFTKLGELVERIVSPVGDGA